MATIVASFANSGVPATGLSATIRIRRTDTQALVVTDAAMTEQGDGSYSYDFTPTAGLDYSIRADGTATLADAERYVFGALSGTTEAQLAELDAANLPADVDTLLARLTALRAANLDQITAARLVELDAANLPADVDALLARLTAPRAVLLDNLSNLDAAISTRGTADPGDAMTLTAGERTAIDAELTAAHGAGAWTGGASLTAQDVRDAMKLAPTAGAPAGGSVDADLDDLTARLTALRAANLDQITAARLVELDPANLPADIDSLLARLTALRAANLDEITAARLVELDAANIPADVDTLVSRLTAPRAALLDNLSDLDVAISTRGTADPGDAMALTPAERTAIDAELTAAHGAGAWTGGGGLTAQDVRDAMKLAPTAGAPAGGSVDADLDDLTARLTALRAANLDEITAARLAELDPANLPADVDTIVSRLTAPRAALLDNLSNLDAAISTRGTADPGDAMTLTAGERTAIDAELTAAHGAGAWTGGASLTAQDVRDAMKLAPTAGAPAGGSVDADLDDLTARLTALRAANLDEITAARLVELDAANLPADVDALLARLTAPRAALLDNLSDLDVAISTRGTADPGDAMTLTAGERTAIDAELTASHGAGAWTGGASLTAQQVRDAMKLAPTAGAPVAGSVDADLDDLTTRLSAPRGALLDNLSDLDVAISTRGTADPGDAMTLTAGERTAIDAELTAAHGAGAWTGSGGGLTAQQVRDAMKLAPTAGAPVAGSVDADLDDLTTRLSAPRGALLDNLSDLDVAISTRGTADPGDAMTLTPAERTAIDAELTAAHGAGLWTGSGGGLTAQQVRDAMKLAPTAGAPAGGSVDADLDDLTARLTALRAANLDQITAARLVELDAANLPADVDALLARLTALRAANLDQITAARLAELDAANLPADVDTLVSRLTAPRAALLDNLANLDAAISTRGTADPGDAMTLTPAERTAIDAELTAAHGAGAWTDAAGLTAQQVRDAMKLAPTAGAPDGGSVDADLDDLTSRLTALRAANLDQITAARLAELDAANMPADIDEALARTVDLEAALAFFGAVIGSPVTHTPTTVTAGGFTWAVTLVGPNVTLTRTA